MDANYLKLNNEITTAVPFGSRQQGKVTFDGLNVRDIVRTQDILREVLWDSQVTMINQNCNVRKTSTLHLLNIINIRKTFIGYRVKMHKSIRL